MAPSMPSCSPPSLPLASAACSRRLFVERGERGDALVKRLVEVVGQIKVGLYDAAEQPFMGAMISEKAALGMVEAQANLQRLGGESLLTPRAWKRAPASSPRAS